MLKPLEGFKVAAAMEGLGSEYTLPKEGVPRFQAVGEDSWAYSWGEWWLSVRRDLRGHVPEAYEGSLRLKQAGLSFVLAPEPGKSGRVVHSAGGRPVVMFRRLRLQPLDSNATVSHDLGGRLVTLLEHLHRSAVRCEVPTEDFRLPFEQDLDLAESIAVDGLAPCGPLGNHLAQVLAANRRWLRDVREQYERLAQAARTDAWDAALTHGEPLAGNFMLHGPTLLLADWGELMYAPRERDLSHVRRTIGSVAGVREELMELYRLRWILSEVAEYTEMLAKPHVGSVDDHAMFGRLLTYLPVRVPAI